jgi:hypothetical protein
MGKHAKLSPSKISRIIRCPGSEDFVQYLINKREIPEEETSVYADEGTMLHQQTERFLQNKPYNKVLDAEQMGAIKDCIDFLMELRQKHQLTWLQTEQRVSLKGYDLVDCDGAADVVAGNAQNTLHIIDWKFGKGVFVPVEENEQLMTYLLGAAVNPIKLEQCEELWIHLCQPRLENYGSYKCDVGQLMGLVNAIKNAEKSYDIIPGEKQCFWCRGKNRCSEYEVMVRGKAALVFQVNDLMKQNEYPFDKMAKVLLLESDFKKIFKAIRDGLNELPREKLNDLGLKRVAGRSNRVWASEETVVEYLCNNYGDVDDIYEEPKLKSPAKIESSIKGVKKDPEFQKLIVKPLGAPTLVSVNDKRPEYGGDAENVFRHLVENK